GTVKLWPMISPKKSREGAFAGLLGSFIIGALCGRYLGMHSLVSAFFAMGIGALGQAGDLAESAIKRYSGVKDSGELLPGHGGILDRFDSLLFSASFVYWVMKLPQLFKP
ncbi:MAG: phosphatidate cytidylyltransferase, partial [bacterium]|nr:phosphatidate cytidylyltransferase [bacterium]